MDLFDVSFTTRKLVKKFDAKGKKIISETQLDTPIVLTGLPYKTAKSYESCDNFKMSPYQPDQRRFDKKGWGGPATKKVQHEPVTAAPKAKAGAVVAKSAVQRAAATGDLTAAINRSA